MNGNLKRMHERIEGIMKSSDNTDILDTFFKESAQDFLNAADRSPSEVGTTLIEILRKLEKIAGGELLGVAATTSYLKNAGIPKESASRQREEQEAQ